MPLVAFGNGAAGIARRWLLDLHADTSRLAYDRFWHWCMRHGSERVVLGQTKRSPFRPARIFIGLVRVARARRRIRVRKIPSPSRNAGNNHVDVVIEFATLLVSPGHMIGHAIGLGNTDYGADRLAHGLSSINFGLNAPITLGL